MSHQYNLNYLQNIHRPCMLEFGFSMFEKEEYIERLAANLRYMGLDIVRESEPDSTDISKILLVNQGIITPLLEPGSIKDLSQLIITAANNANITPCGLPHPVFPEQITSPERTNIYEEIFAKYADKKPNFADYMLDKAANSPQKMTYEQLLEKTKSNKEYNSIFSGGTLADPYHLCTEYLNRNIKYATSDLHYALRFTNERIYQQIL